MIIAFDLGKTLSAHPALRAVARGLLRVGCRVHIISAVYRKDEARARAMIDGWGVPFTGIHFVYQDNLPMTAAGIGRAKGEVMASIGAAILFDDNPAIVQWLNEAGWPAEVVPRP